MDDTAADQQLDDYARVLRLFDATNATLRLHEARLDAHIALICERIAASDRQDTALTEAESRIADLEKANAELWQALAAQTSTIDALRLTLARTNLRCL